MPATYDGDVVRAGQRARERFYDSRGYGRPVNGELVLAPVEAAHLLFRGDLEAVLVDGDPQGFRTFLAAAGVPEVDFIVYKDLRDRGFYLSPAAAVPELTVYPRGSGPWDGDVAYRVRPISERSDVSTATLRSLTGGDADGVLAVVDEESEVTYLGVDRPAITGSSSQDLPGTMTGSLRADRVVVADPPPTLHERAFYGQPVGDDLLQLSLVEAASLAAASHLSVDGGEPAIAERGRAVEGERFDRRLRVYTALRTAGIVPKTGFKFGADFRTYADVTSVEDLGHSEMLVRVVPDDHDFAPRDLALDVRLAGGVRKRMIYALTDAADGINWLAVSRLTP